MTVSRPVRILVGLATAWVACYPLLILCVILATVGMAMMGETAGSAIEPFVKWLAESEFASELGLPSSFFFTILPLQCVTIGLMFALQGFYVIHVLMNKDAPESVRIILGIGVILMSPIAMPIYYYAFLWRSEPPEWARESLAEASD
jgi:hypothetical protein